MLREKVDELLLTIMDVNDENQSIIIRKARQKARVTIRELSGITGLKINEISNIEHGRLEITEDMAIAIISIFACKIIIQKEILEGGLKK